MKFSNLQNNIEKEAPNDKQIEQTPSYASVVKNEKPYEKQPFWLSGKREQPPGMGVLMTLQTIPHFGFSCNH